MTAGSLTTTATPASAATTWLQVSAGYAHTCGVTSAHDLWCWGDNHYGQLGTGDTKDRLVPARIGAKGIWASVSAGAFFTCALDRDSKRYCWGDNRDGQLGYDDKANRLTPTPFDYPWTMISAGGEHACGILPNRRTYCWGSNSRGQLGIGSTGGNQPSAQRVQFDGRWSSISAGDLATCGLDSEGTRYCWGDNRNGALGLGAESVTYITTPKTWGDGIWRSVTTGYSNGCGISEGGRLYCWGRNNYGQLGVGDSENRFEPTRVSGKNWAQVSMGWSHACGLKTDGVGYCWGDNSNGRLGIGTDALSSHPSPAVIYDVSKAFKYMGDLVIPFRTPEDPMTWSSLSAGAEHTCGIRTDGILLCWGDNSSGQLGDGTTTDRFSPHEVA